MKKLKFDSLYKMKDIRILYDTTVIHANSENDFGLFCLGAAVGLRSVFDCFRKETPFNEITQDTKAVAITTAMLLDTFKDSKRDLAYAEMKHISNKKQSKIIKRIAEETRTIRDKKMREESNG